MVDASDLDLCRCELAVERLVFRNTGQFTDRLTIAYSSPDLVSIGEGVVELLPGEEKVVYAYIQAPCDDDVDRMVRFEVTDLFGQVESVEQALTVGRCQNLEASLLVDQVSSVAPCQPVTYTVLVRNTGVFAETYDISFGDAELAHSFSQEAVSIIVPAGGEGSVSSTMTLDCAVSGTVAVPFEVYARNSELVAELQHDLVVDPAYDFSISLDVPQDICALDNTSIPLTIANDASFANTYTLILSGPGFLSLEATNISLAPSEERMVLLTAAPDLAWLGDRSFSVQVTDGFGGMAQTWSGNVSVLRCYDTSVNVQLQEDIVDCAGTRSYPVLVRNTGLVDEELRLDLFGSEYARIEPVNLELAAGEEVNASLVIDVPPGIALDAGLVVRATVLGKEDVFSEDVIHVSLLDERACFEPELVRGRARARYDAESIPFTIINTGLGAADYELAFVGEQFFGLNQTAVSLTPGQSQAFSLATYQSEDPVYSSYETLVRVFVRSADGERVLTYDLPFRIDFRQRCVVLRAGDYFAAHPCQLVSALIVLFLIVAAVMLLARAQVPRRRVKGLFLALFVVWIIVIVLAFSIKGAPASLYEPVIQDAEDPLTVYVAEDTSFSLDVGDFFVDPDLDPLSFMVSEMGNVSSVVNGSVVTFTPEPDWFGERRFRLTAFDGQGGATESPRMHLVVVDRPEYNAWSLYSRYCIYVNLVLFFLVILAVSCLARRPLRKEPVEVKPLPPLKDVPAAKKRSPRKRAAKKVVEEQKEQQ